jgi:hypothetical protein
LVLGETAHHVKDLRHFRAASAYKVGNSSETGL